LIALAASLSSVYKAETIHYAYTVIFKFDLTL